MCRTYVEFFPAPPALRQWHLGLQLDSVWIAGLLMGFVKLSAGETPAVQFPPSGGLKWVKRGVG